MTGHDAGQSNHPRKRFSAEIATHGFAAIARNIEAHRQDVATGARSDGVDNATYRARRVLEVAKRADRTGRRYVEPCEVLGRGHDRKIIRLVHRQPLGRVPRLREPPPATKAGKEEPLGHVFLVVPFVELFAPLMRNVIPYEDRAMSEQGPGECNLLSRRRSARYSDFSNESRLRFHGHRPMNSGGRLARKAAAPSWRSLLSKISCCATVDIESAASRGMSCAASTTFSRAGSRGVRGQRWSTQAAARYPAPSRPRRPGSRVPTPAPGRQRS